MELLDFIIIEGKFVQNFIPLYETSNPWEPDLTER
jgi:hypothetical protein